MLKETLVVLFASSLLVACGGGDGGGSGVDGSKELTALSDEEIIEICEYSEGLIDYVHFNEIDCYFDGIFDQEGGDCQTIADACIAESVPEAGDCSDAAEDPLPACAAMVSVGEMEDCLEAQASQFNGFDVDCDSTDEELNEIFEAPLPAACVAVEMKCPDLFGDSSDA